MRAEAQQPLAGGGAEVDARETRAFLAEVVRVRSLPGHGEQRVPAKLGDAGVAVFPPEVFLEARHDFAPVPGPGLRAPHLRGLVLGERGLERDARDGDARRDRHHRARRGDGHAAAFDDDAAFGALRDLSRIRAETDGAGRQGLGQSLRERGVAAIHAKRARTARCHILAAAGRALAPGCADAAVQALGNPRQTEFLRHGGDVRLVREPRPRRPQVRALGGGKAPAPDAVARLEHDGGEARGVQPGRGGQTADPRAHDHDVAVQGLGGRRHLGRRGHRARHQQHSREGGETRPSSEGSEESSGV
mmetsp:Transcript_1686/g.6758  ORF Transcript_1686/g.6758 Transcript_1686/m.6758 type:complete len:304 (+) Transcript_1686:485-1396(+)